jgi:hypothetical protein
VAEAIWKEADRSPLVVPRARPRRGLTTSFTIAVITLEIALPRMNQMASPTTLCSRMKFIKPFIELEIIEFLFVIKFNKKGALRTNAPFNSVRRLGAQQLVCVQQSFVCVRWSLFDGQQSLVCVRWPLFDGQQSLFF